MKEDDFIEPTQPTKVKKTSKGIVPWGADNNLPNTIRNKVFDSDVVAPNIELNIKTAYGRGLTITDNQGYPLKTKKEIYKEQIEFFKRNSPVKLMWEGLTDIKMWYWTVVELVLSADRSKIVKIKYHDAYDIRFESCNKDGRIENILIANWDEDTNGEKAEKIPLLDPSDPWGDIMIRLGKLPNDEGKNAAQKDLLSVAYLISVPAPGRKYYPFPYWWSIFRSGWYDISQAIAKAKLSKMANSFKIKYVVEIHKDYFKTLFETEKITDEKAQQARIETAKNEITEFLQDQGNKDKTFFSIYYQDKITKKDVSMIRITCVDKTKEGGEWLPDIEQASAMICNAMGVNSTLNGATPNSSKGSMGGSDKRELFNIKGSYEIPIRDLFIEMYELVADVNGWDTLNFSINDTIMTTLDAGGDAKVQDNDKNKSDDKND